jgi:hypothetical protein
MEEREGAQFATQSVQLMRLQARVHVSGWPG